MRTGNVLKFQKCDLFNCTKNLKYLEIFLVSKMLQHSPFYRQILMFINSSVHNQLYDDYPFTPWSEE